MSEAPLEQLENLRVKYEGILTELSGNASFLAVIEDMKENAKSMDESWAYIDPETNKASYDELRCNKIACNMVINILDSYRNELEDIKSRIARATGDEGEGYYEG